ncbi:putative glucose-6-phosphate 1-epimerase [Nymphaea thermarum]|nr:putative glucose-6-phosphate 1-epimerase [Nymphaea thermarum]
MSDQKSFVFVETCKGVNGLDKVILREVRGSSAEAIFKPSKPIRGGIPICFPQFSSHGTLEQHGFARNRFWSIDTDPPPFPTSTSSKAFVDLILRPSEDDLKIWPHRRRVCTDEVTGSENFTPNPVSHSLDDPSHAREKQVEENIQTVTASEEFLIALRKGLR